MPIESSETSSSKTSITSVSGSINLDAGHHVNIGGDVVGRDKIIQNIHHIYQQALTAAEEADKAQSIEARHLAYGVSALAQRLKSRASETEDAAAPYRGLLEYRLSDAMAFFGRERAIADLLRHVQQGNLTVLHSESGAGKTSLLQAGVAPRLLFGSRLPIYVRPYDVDPALKIKREFVVDLRLTPLLAQSSLRDFLRRVCSVLGDQRHWSS